MKLLSKEFELKDGVVSDEVNQFIQDIGYKNVINVEESGKILIGEFTTIKIWYWSKG